MGFYDFNSPTPMDLIAEKICNLRIMYENLDDDLPGTLGLLDLDNKAIWIDISLDHLDTDQFIDEARCNFTMGHEIGHFILDHAGGNKNLIDFHNEFNPETKKAETQANMVAAMLLMPRELAIRKWNEDFADTFDLGDRIIQMMIFFRSSRETTVNRLNTLGLLKKY